MSSLNKFYELFTPIIEDLGFKCWGIEYLKQGIYSVLRIYIENEENGITVDDCESVSHHISAILDVEGLINGEYNLEVSSPGMDRILFTLNQLERFINEKMRLETYITYGNRRKFIGSVDRIEDEVIFFQSDNQIYQINYNDIQKVRVIPTF